MSSLTRQACLLRLLSFELSREAEAQAASARLAGEVGRRRSLGSNYSNLPSAGPTGGRGRRERGWVGWLSRAAFSDCGGGCCCCCCYCSSFIPGCSNAAALRKGSHPGSCEAASSVASRCVCAVAAARGNCGGAERKLGDLQALRRPSRFPTTGIPLTQIPWLGIHPPPPHPSLFPR